MSAPPCRSLTEKAMLVLTAVVWLPAGLIGWASGTWYSSRSTCRCDERNPSESYPINSPAQDRATERSPPSVRSAGSKNPGSL